MKKLLLLTFCLVTLTSFSQIELVYDFESILNGNPGASDKKNVYLFEDYMNFTFVPGNGSNGMIWRTDGTTTEPLVNNSSN